MRSVCMCVCVCDRMCLSLCIPSAGLVNGSVSLRFLFVCFSFLSLIILLFVSACVCPYWFLFFSPTSAQQCLTVQHLKSSATVYVHKHYVYIISYLTHQFCVQYVIGIVLTLYLCIKFMAEDSEVCCPTCNTWKM